MSSNFTVEQLHDVIKARLVPLLAQHLDYLDLDATPDQRQKYIEWAVKTIGAEAEKKNGGNGLATVVINIGDSGQITLKADQAPELVEVVETAAEPQLPAPTQAMQAAPAIDDDMAALFKELDEC